MGLEIKNTVTDEENAFDGGVIDMLREEKDGIIKCSKEKARKESGRQKKEVRIKAMTRKQLQVW